MMEGTKSYKMMMDPTSRFPVMVMEQGCGCYGDWHVRNAGDAVGLLNAMFQAEMLAEEHMWEVCLDTKNRVLGVFEVSHGAVSYSVCNPREVFLRALAIGAVRVVLAHNHPSGDATPSTDDDRATDSIRKAGELLQMPLLDHIIIGDRAYYSYKDVGKL